MKLAIIDMGSNSIRLTLYETDGMSFKILFREKIMAGLAAYVVKGALSSEGIECAITALICFKGILETLKIDNVSIFATASLRNINNTDVALSIIKDATGYSVEVLSGKDEALLGYTGAMKELNLSSGVFIDVGGASSEIVVFDRGRATKYDSFAIGSLSLFKQSVKKIIPGDGAIRRIKHTISEEIDTAEISQKPNSLLVAVGGTARAVINIARHYYSFSEDSHSMTKDQVDELCSFLSSGKKEAIDLILRLEAERIHTIIPGFLIIQHIMHLYDAKQFIVSSYGVREGYLCQRILKNDTYTPKTEN